MEFPKFRIVQILMLAFLLYYGSFVIVREKYFWPSPKNVGLIWPRVDGIPQMKPSLGDIEGVRQKELSARERREDCTAALRFK